jgi:hypothetical protein
VNRGIVRSGEKPRSKADRVVDEGVFRLCEEVCGSVQEQLRTLSELVAGVSR